METSKKLKQLIKPNINEGALEQYLMAKGINPKFVSTQTKISHAKSSAFIKWKQDHMMESTDKKDTVVLDIPLLIRVLELAREDIKTDMDLHRVVEKLISIRTKGVLTMDDYNTIANIKENHIAIAMGKMLDDEGSMILDQMDQLERAITMIRTYVGKDYEKQLPAWVQSKITLATDYVDTVGNYLSSKNEEVVSEVSSELLDRYKEKAKKSADELTSKGQHKKSTDRWMGVMKATGKQIEKTTANIKKTLGKEEVVYETKKDDGYTKSARMIKAIYGKLPKTKTLDTKNNVGDKAQAAAVLTGGKTLTGQTRDTLEIDPVMRKGDPLELQKQQKKLR
jgi:hypothetical protein